MNVEEAIHLASQRLRAGEVAGAERLYRQALAVKSNCFEAIWQLGVCLCRLNRPTEAIPLFRRALALRPDALEVLGNLAGVLHQIGRVDLALPVHQQALELDRTSPNLWNDLGVAHFKLGDYDAAITHYRRAIELRPDHAEAHNNLGCALKHLALYDQALVAFGKSLALRPDYPAPHWNLGLIFLLRGELSLGWPEYEWRWSVKELSPPRVNFSQPRWEGQDLRDKRILLYTEQGFGDAIQFVRYVPRVAQLGAKVILACQAELLSLFGNVPGVEEALPIDQTMGGFDVHCPLMSLPRVFNTTLADIPWQVPYLHSPVAHVQRWRQRLANEGELKIGLAWAGLPTHANDRNRSLSLAALEPLTRARPARFIGLQKGEAARQAANIQVTDCSEELTDFAQTAALIRNLDLVITADTAVAHLAGALGKLVWVLVPFVPDWRWMLRRSDSPWYPTMRLFRQPAAGDWQTPIKQIVEELRSL